MGDGFEPVKKILADHGILTPLDAFNAGYEAGNTGRMTEQNSGLHWFNSTTLGFFWQRGFEEGEKDKDKTK